MKTWLTLSVTTMVLLGLMMLIRTGVLHGWADRKEEGVPGELIDRVKEVQEKRLLALQKELDSNIPRSPYLVINSTENTFSLFRGKELIKKDRCSTGSYLLLKNGDQQQWMFKTPKGEFRVRGRTTRPVWRKPDWAFVEAGLVPPPPGHPSRYEAGVLGAYALDLGQGYLIHGTLYQRFLGLPVTHGCIRLGDDNLELVYRSLPLGGYVYIF